jgi:CYTH domain-containing protein
MDKTNPIELRRLFLVDWLPEPLSRASAHIQIFDNYIANTRMRLRSVRDPETKEWTRILQQGIQLKDDLTQWKVSEIYLNEGEYAQFQIFEGMEIRKNRYFLEIDGRMAAFDVFLGNLWGLCMARVEFDTAVELERFEPPGYFVFEVTSDPFFTGTSLVTKTINEIKVEVAKLGAELPVLQDNREI